MEMNIKPGVEELPKVTVLEQQADYMKYRLEYSNGFIIIGESTDDEINLMTNVNLVELSNGSYAPDFDSPNKNFIDVI